MPTKPRSALPLGSAHRVGAAELFFDLVFVFAFTQVTSLLANRPTPIGFVHGLVVIGLVWWAWGSFAWLTNAREADTVAMRLILLAGMSGMLVVGLGVPTAFADGALLVAAGIGTTRLVWILAYRRASQEDPDYSAAVRRLGAGAVIVPVALVVGALLGRPYQLWIWLAALAFDYATPIIARPRGWKVDPAHFSERFGLIVIIALGEEVVAVGLATTGSGAVAPELAATVGSLIGLLVAALMWALYFAHLAEAGEQALHRSEGIERILIARDAYTYAHVIPVAGVVLTALGAKKVLAHPGAPVAPVVLVALTVGAATYLAGVAVIAWRVARIRWGSTWLLSAGLVACGLSAVPSWWAQDERVAWTSASGLLCLMAVAAALLLAASVKPTAWRAEGSVGPNSPTDR